jgi:DNA-binding transcriptional MerR regulator
MNVATVSNLIEASPDSVRRWCLRYRQFMSPTATPQKGKTRNLTIHDAAVLSYIASARDNGLEHDEIAERLAEMQANGWSDLPELQVNWIDDGSEDTMPVEAAAVRASQIAQIAVLQNELEHSRTELQNVKVQLAQAIERAEGAEQRVIDLQAEMQGLRGSESAERDKLRDELTAEKQRVENELHAAQLEVEKARGEVAALQARLSSYAITGGEKPIPVALIIVVTALVAVVLVLVVLVVVRLVL